MENNNTVKMLNEKMTLRELLALTTPTNGISLPTPKALRLGSVPVAVYSRDNFSLTVYKNGFVAARTWKRYTVIRLDCCKDYRYATVHEKLARQKNSATKPDIKFEEFLDSPWPVRLLLTAEDRLEENNDLAAWRAICEHSEIAADVQQYNRYIHGESVENQVIEKMMREEMIKKLTDKQREVVELYYGEGYTQAEIAEMLGISQMTVSEMLENALKKFRKCANENGG